MSKYINLFLSTVFIFVFAGANCQKFSQWSTPEPLTDSLTNNTNPFMVRTFYPYKLLLVWERSPGSSHTSIYLDDILNESPPLQIISDSGVHYTHPQLLYFESYPNSDTLFYLFYETNQNGNQDIYMIAFLNDSIFLTPVPIANSLADEGQIAVSKHVGYFKNLDYQIKSISWISDGDLFAKSLLSDENSYYFSESILIDSNWCSDPSFNGLNQLIYTKETSVGTSIYKVTGDNTGAWSSPEVIYDSTHAMNATSSLHYNLPCWTAYIDSSWTIMLDYPGKIYNVTSDIPLNPSVTGVVWDDLNEEEVFIALVLEENGYDEIFMNPSTLSVDFLNFTTSGTMNQNPQFFIGEIEGMIYNWSNYLIWESFRNNHWQIWYSKIFMGFSDISESKIENYSAKAYPNPFTTSTAIEYELTEPSDIQLTIYNTIGKVLYQAEDRNIPPGTHNVTWSPGHLPAGLYYAVLRSGEGVSVVKLIKQ